MSSYLHLDKSRIRLEFGQRHLKPAQVALDPVKLKHYLALRVHLLVCRQRCGKAAEGAEGRTRNTNGYSNGQNLSTGTANVSIVRVDPVIVLVPSATGFSQRFSVNGGQAQPRLKNVAAVHRQVPPSHQL